MLNLTKQLKISSYPGIYDVIVPQTHILRKIRACVDFSFVNQLMIDCYCIAFGRPAKEPELMLKLLFLKLLYDLSDREVISRATTDLAFKYFLGLDPEDELPHHSLLTKFRTMRLTEEKLNAFLKETVRQAIDKKLIKSTTIIVDSTHTRSKHTPQTPTQMLREMTKNLRYEIYKTQTEVSLLFPEKPGEEEDVHAEIEYTKKLVEYLEAVELTSEKAIKKLKSVKEVLAKPNLAELQSNQDEDAKIGHKSEDADFFGFKNHLAMTEEGIIVGATVTNGTAADSKELEVLVEQAIDAGVEVQDVSGDKAFSTSDNIKFCKEKEINLISKLKDNVTTTEYEDEHVWFNKDSGTYICKHGVLSSRRKPNKQGRYEYAFPESKCRSCPYAKKCLGKNKVKRVWKNVDFEIFKEHKEFESTTHFKEKAKSRWKIEQRNAHLKNRYGLDKTYGTGLQSMRAQSILTSFTANIAKITKLTEAA